LILVVVVIVVTIVVETILVMMLVALRRERGVNDLSLVDRGALEWALSVCGGI
jgi:heme/copper-type cytochrome/quinol oxidase subunit 2